MDVNTLVLLIPLFLLIIAIEWYVGYRNGNPHYGKGSFAINLSIGLIDQLGALGYMALLYLVLHAVYTQFALVELGWTWYAWVLSIIAIDFISYWYHRFSHEWNIFWAGHITHHQAEHYNLSISFRLSIFQGLNRIMFWLPLPVLGFDPLMLLIGLKINGLYQFILHTEYIPKLGILEHILITPSSHRVHHGKNDLYLDKNYGSIFVIWDKLFGTYQPETEKVHYGITSPFADNNPYHAIGHYYVHIWRLMQTQRGIINKLKVLFRSPMWSPADAPYPPVPVRVATPIPRWLHRYAIAQLCTSTVGGLLLLLFHEFVPVWEFWLLAALMVITMSNGAMLVSGNLQTLTVRYEKWLQPAFALACLAAWFATGSLYWLPAFALCAALAAWQWAALFAPRSAYKPFQVQN